MAEYTSKKQTNQGWNLSWSALDRYPMIAKRRFATLADAQAFVDDVAPGASATEGLILAVINDKTAKNNGVYYVQSVANTDAEYGPILEKGTLVKVGGTETETATNYSAAKELSKTLVVGQLIKVANPEEIEETVDGKVVKNTYQAGFYIVEGAGVISALATSTGSDDEVGALKTRVTALETGKVDKVEGSRLMTDAEGTKLAGIAEGAQVNYVKNVGDHLNVDSDGVLTVDLSSKVDKTDYTTGMTAVNNAIANKTDYSAFTAHVQDEVAHITADERLAWNAAEKNAKDYAKELVMDGETPRFDVAGAAATAEQNAKDYADGKFQEKGNYEEAGAAAKALEDAEKYADSLVKDAEGKSLFDAAGAAAQALEDAKGYANGLASNYDAAGAAATAEQNAKDYTDDEIEKAIGVYASEGVEASGLRKEIAEVAAEAKSYSMVTVEGEELSGLGTNVREAYKLVDEDNKQSGDYIKIYKDSSLKSVVLEGQILNFTYILADGSEDTVGVDVSAFLAESEFGDGLQVVEHVVSVKVAEGSESFLTVDENGVKLSGVQDAINNAKDVATAYTNTREVEINKAWAAADEVIDSKAQGYASDAQAAAIETATAYTDTKISEVQGSIEALADIVGEGAEGETDTVMAKLAALAAKDAAQDEEIGKKAAQADLEALSATVETKAAQSDLEALEALVGNRAEGDSASVFEKLAALAEGKLNATATINGQSFVDGAAVIDAGDIALESAIMSDNGEGGSVEQYAASSSIHAVLQSLNNRITAAVSGGLTSVSAGSGIEVSGVIGNSQSVSIKVSAAENNAVVLNTDGIYVEQIIVDGNDTEE